MRLVILTTDTKHHTYFINELSKVVNDVHVIYETKKLIKPYKTGPFFQEEEEEFEEKFFENSPRHFSKKIKSRIRTYDTCNNKECISHIKKVQPDVIISFGVGLLKAAVYSTAKICSLNIHRGYISEYRGLDSDLWALYNKEFNKIGVAIHLLSEKLDTGDVIKQKTISVDRKIEVFHIRYLTTLLATNMMKGVITEIIKTGETPKSDPQKKVGKYYSAMSLDKKMKAKENLDIYFKEKEVAVILLYHGVTNSESSGVENFSCKHIAASDFEAQMKYIKKNLNPVPLRTMVRILNEKKELTPGLVTVTFDDSFKNIHDVALPILEETEVPATFFVTTGMVATSRRYWVDRLEHMINHAKIKNLRIELDETKQYSLATDNQKIECIIDIKRFLKAAPPKVRERILKDIKNATQFGASMIADNYQNLSWEDVQRLDKSPLCEVGGHTVNHEILSYLEDKELDYEITQCIEDLKTNLGHKVDLFSYPEGQAEHYNQRVIDKLKERGISICPSAINGVNSPGEDAFNLKRVMVDFMGTDFPYSGYKSE